MSSRLNRREFIAASAMAGAVLAARPLTAETPTGSVRVEDRMTPNPATKYRSYVSQPVQSADTSTWLQFDLGTAFAIEGVRLYPGFSWGPPSLGFPSRMKIEASNSPGFDSSALLFDHTAEDMPEPGDHIIYVTLNAPASKYRYIRLTATRLRHIGDGGWGGSRLNTVSRSPRSRCFRTGTT